MRPNEPRSSGHQNSLLGHDISNSSAVVSVACMSGLRPYYTPVTPTASTAAKPPSESQRGRSVSLSAAAAISLKATDLEGKTAGAEGDGLASPGVKASS